MEERLLKEESKVKFKVRCVFKHWQSFFQIFWHSLWISYSYSVLPKVLYAYPETRNKLTGEETGLEHKSSAPQVDVLSTLLKWKRCQSIPWPKGVGKKLEFS